MFPPQIGRVKRLLSQLLNHCGGLFGRKRTTDLRNLQGDPNLRPLFGKMLHVWDGNHRLQAWFPCIKKVHPFDAD